MDCCSVEFVPIDMATLARTTALFEQIRASKEEGVALDDSVFSAQLTDGERSFFWSPSEDERAEWSAMWLGTPPGQRHLLPGPQWDLGSMLDSIADGEYDLMTIEDRGQSHHLLFNPLSYPFGGTGCMVAFLECFGHKVITINDGTGRVPYAPRLLWKPKGR
ncbi:hypothetical protein ATSB10_01520 [Dyella thiooxydans]|uniref:Uncharacterized protein n=2 Tax=Dyella thiooxydans TaxID=445710 RepID=A0A160MWW5_9GAMM|nr:hypothetical protein ATSB10_01520 [Dyella thiooxydans]